MPLQHYLACDLGAESGRLMLGSLDEGRLDLEELHRFPNGAVPEGDSLHWDIPALWQGVLDGLTLAGQRGLPIAGISSDAWGLDYLFFDREDVLMSPSFHYRDPRTARGMERVLGRLDRKTIYSETGIQFMPINTLFQLAAETPERLEQVRRILLVGDAINFMLSGRAATEVSMASTSQLYNPVTRQWSELLLADLDLPEARFGSIVPSGTVLGPLKTDIANQTGLGGQVQVVAGCSHDTGAAVAAVPAEPGAEPWAYISSGTWSLMGVERETPLLTDACRELNFTNEIGYGHSVRLLKNLIGLWLVQECRRTWMESSPEEDFSYRTLTLLAEEAPPFARLIQPADPRFVPPGGMPERIADYCRETGQPVPESVGATIRCILESLALLYRATLEELTQLTGRRPSRIHILGGGGQNQLLNQLTANACQATVWAGPVEATSVGNILVQALALKAIDSLDEARRISRDSFPVAPFIPQDKGAWETAYHSFQKLPH